MLPFLTFRTSIGLKKPLPDTRHERCVFVLALGASIFRDAPIPPKVEL